MQRKTLVFDGIPYLVEHYSVSELKGIKSITYKKFVMLRQYEIFNEVARDKEIYFVAASDYAEAIQYDKETKKIFQTDKICYPVNDNEAEIYSSNAMRLMTSSRLSSLIYRENVDKDYYILRDKNGDMLEVPCDEIRIYIPHNRNKLPAIINVSNLLNGIHFHYFCQNYDYQPISIGKEKRIRGNSYYEYITFYIPNLDFLFNSENTFYNEDLNLMQFDIESNIWNQLYNIAENDGNVRVPLISLILPYKIDRVCNKNIECDECPLAEQGCPLIDFKNAFIKSFVVHDFDSEQYKNTEYNYKNSPLVVSLYHFDSYDTNLGLYYSSENIGSSSIEFTENNKFYLTCRFGFDKHDKSIFSIISEFEYPKLLKYERVLNEQTGITETVSHEMSLQEAYCYLNKISDFDEYLDFTAYEDEDFLEDNFTEEFIESLKFNTLGYVVELSTSRSFSGVFYRSSIAANEIDNFSFHLNNVFNDWHEYPEVIFIRTLFIDKYLAKIFYSPVMVLTKEYFKYCINETANDYRLEDLVDFQKPIDNVKPQIDSEDMENLYFIDKINCSVRKHDVLNEQTVIGGGLGNGQIIYKTVFYKTQDLQNIRLRANVTQKIGINLGDFMSKVESFKLKLGGFEFTEVARNDVYVIFTIPAASIESITGFYDIVNEDDEYIDSGKYTIY